MRTGKAPRLQGSSRRRPPAWVSTGARVFASMAPRFSWGLRRLSRCRSCCTNLARTPICARSKNYCWRAPVWTPCVMTRMGRLSRQLPAGTVRRAGLYIQQVQKYEKGVNSAPDEDGVGAVRLDEAFSRGIRWIGFSLKRSGSFVPKSRPLYGEPAALSSATGCFDATVDLLPAAIAAAITMIIMVIIIDRGTEKHASYHAGSGPDYSGILGLVCLVAISAVIDVDTMPIPFRSWLQPGSIAT